MSRSRYVILEPDKPHFLTCTVVEWLPVFTRPDAVQFLLDSWTHLRQHDGFQGNETTGRWSAMGCVPTLERGNDKTWVTSINWPGAMRRRGWPTCGRWPCSRNSPVQPITWSGSKRGWRSKRNKDAGWTPEQTRWLAFLSGPLIFPREAPCIFRFAPSIALILNVNPA